MQLSMSLDILWGKSVTLTRLSLTTHTNLKYRLISFLYILINLIISIFEEKLKKINLKTLALILRKI